MTALPSLLDGHEPDPKPRLSFMQVTPELAERWLTRNLKNRNIRPQTVARYARDMKAGKWHLDGSPIRFSADRALLDGQHRLAAIIEAGVTITTAVAVGIDPAAQAVMDTGRARTAADMLAIDGETNATTLAAAARFGIEVERGEIDLKGEVSHEEVAAFVAANPSLRHAVEFTKNLARKTDCPPSIVAYAFMVMSRIDPFAAGNFWVSASEKVGLKTGDPVLAMTNRFAEARRNRARLSRAAYLSVIFRAWNYRRAGKSLHVVKISSPAGGMIPIPEPR